MFAAVQNTEMCWQPATGELRSMATSFCLWDAGISASSGSVQALVAAVVQRCCAQQLVVTLTAPLRFGGGSILHAIDAVALLLEGCRFT